jgi:hypothetical protein
MLPVRVTVAVAGRSVSVEDLADARVASALRSAAQDIGRRLGNIRCPEHARTATDVRVHFDESGRADLRYESCCEKLGKSIGAAVGDSAEGGARR